MSSQIPDILMLQVLSFELLISSFKLILFTAPKIQIMITGSDKVKPIAGQSYNLTCSVQGAKNLDSSITYQWIKNDIIRQNSSTLSFSPLRLSDAGVYTCRVTVSSDYLDNDLTANSSISLNISSKPLLKRNLTCMNYTILL